MRMAPTGPVIMRALCSLCRDERQRECYEVGRVELRTAARVWVTHDPRWRRAGRVTAKHLSRTDSPDLELPGQLPGHCRRHGWGHVDTRDVLNIRGTSVLAFSPQT